MPIVIVVEICLAAIVKVPEVAPAGITNAEGIVTSDGTPAESVIAQPPTGAGDVNVTVAVEDSPPPMVVGFNVIELIESPVMVIVAVALEPESDALTVVETVLALWNAVTEKVAVVAPAGTVTLAGTFAYKEYPAAKVTVQPPAGAGPARVTVPVEVPFPPIDVGFRVSEVMELPWTVNVAVLLDPAYVAVIVFV